MDCSFYAFVNLASTPTLLGALLERVAPLIDINKSTIGNRGDRKLSTSQYTSTWHQLRDDGQT